MVRADGRIDDAKWRAASTVGTCRRCGHQMAPGKPVDVSGRTDYEARCTNPAATRAMRGGVMVDIPCDYTINAPGGRTYTGTTRANARKRG